MKVHCPICSAPAAVENLNLANGWGKCLACQELFLIADAVPGFRPSEPSSPPAPERPFNARSVVVRDANEFAVLIPPEGMRAGNWGALAFALVWCAVIFAFTVAMLASPDNDKAADGSFRVLILLPFWLVGLGLFGMVIHRARSTRSIKLAVDVLTMQWRAPFWSQTRSVPINLVQNARQFVPTVYYDGMNPWAVELVFHQGSFVLPVADEAEEVWLIAEINQHLQSLK